MNNEKKEFNVGDLVVVTKDMNNSEDYFDKGSVGKVVRTLNEGVSVDVDYIEDKTYWSNKVWETEIEQLKHYTPVEGLPLWKFNHMYLNDEQQQALRKLLHRVQWDEEYAEKIGFFYLDRPEVDSAFSWTFTDEGYDFWNVVYEQCTNEEIQQEHIIEEQPIPNGGSSALATQEGGSHYKKCGIQPVEYIQANNLDYFQGNVIKYTTRHKDKNGVEDIKKAIHYLQLILELQYGE